MGRPAGYKAPDETVERNRAAARRTWADPQVRKRRVDATRAFWAMCGPCRADDHLLCDGGGCRCLYCALELDVRRPPRPPATVLQ